ncbi:MAG: bifunctional UDP-N-acetylglucosamine diphosphorylase/glucosamine-1-phosphate N-acetyltransferase GlmU [Pikeienuella sp.]
MSKENQVAAIILAAGDGTRMKSSRAKPLHEVAGRSLLGHALKATEVLGAASTVVVTAPGASAVAAEVARACPDAMIAEQAERLGTGHAVRMAEPALADFDGDAVVLFADTPFISPETLGAMRDALAQGAAVVALGFEAADPTGYGRMIAEGTRLDRIVEHKDASDAERTVTLCNSGVIAADAALLFALLSQVGNDNANGEYYLPDVVGLARAAGHECAVVRCHEDETLGVNSRADLAKAEGVFQSRARRAAMADGVTLIDPATVWFSYDTELARDVLVEPNVVFAPGVQVAEGARIRAHSHLEGCRVAPDAVIGPYARLRPGANIGAGAKVGNFVEVKNAVFGEGAKANHLAYVGDADVGAGANIGAGVVTCNYDGVMKHRTTIGQGAFVGTNSSLVAPVKLGEGAYVASGSVITRDVAADALAITRAKQMEKPGFVARFRSKLLAIKAAQADKPAAKKGD